MSQVAKFILPVGRNWETRERFVSGYGFSHADEAGPAEFGFNRCQESSKSSGAIADFEPDKNFLTRADAHSTILARRFSAAIV
jgi:hypothetical protein